MRFQTRILVFSCFVLMGWPNIGLAGVVAVLDVDGDPTNGPDTVFVEPLERVDVGVWLVGDEEVSGFSVAVEEPTGNLAWIRTRPNGSYFLPEDWTPRHPRYESERAVVEATDFTGSTPVGLPRRVARLAYTATASSGSYPLRIDPQQSGWFGDGASGEFGGLTALVVHVEGTLPAVFPAAIWPETTTRVIESRVIDAGEVYLYGNTISRAGGYLVEFGEDFVQLNGVPIMPPIDRQWTPKVVPGSNSAQYMGLMSDAHARYLDALAGSEDLRAVKEEILETLASAQTVIDSARLSDGGRVFVKMVGQDFWAEVSFAMHPTSATAESRERGLRREFEFICNRLTIGGVIIVSTGRGMISFSPKSGAGVLPSIRAEIERARRSTYSELQRRVWDSKKMDHSVAYDFKNPIRLSGGR